MELDGNVAVIGNGAGLVMSTLDLVEEADLKPACFLDLGGGASFERILSALALVNKFEKATKIFLNIFGGITSCADVAKAIVETNRTGILRKPLYARISGAEEDEARRILGPLNLKVHTDPEEAITSLRSGS